MRIGTGPTGPFVLLLVWTLFPSVWTQTCSDSIDPSFSFSAPDPSCPSPCHDCTHGVCHIEVSSNAPMVTCPTGWPCEMVCDGNGACASTHFQCSDELCSVWCQGSDACQHASFTCGAGGCGVQCYSSGPSDVCADTTLTCNGGTCGMQSPNTPPSANLLGTGCTCLNGNCTENDFCQPLPWPSSKQVCDFICDTCTSDGVCVANTDDRSDQTWTLFTPGYFRVNCNAQDSCSRTTIDKHVGFLEVNCIGADSCVSLVAHAEDGVLLNCFGAGSCAGASVGSLTTYGALAVHCEPGVTPGVLLLDDNSCLACSTKGSDCAVSNSAVALPRCSKSLFINSLFPDPSASCSAGVPSAWTVQDPAAACPTACNRGCNAGVCHIKVNNKFDQPVCPSGWSCAMQCPGAGKCDTETFTCSDELCVIDCSGYESCNNANFQCGAGGCLVLCDDTACASSTLNCTDTTASCGVLALSHEANDGVSLDNVLAGADTCDVCKDEECTSNTFCQPMLVPSYQNICDNNCDECTSEGVCVKRCFAADLTCSGAGTQMGFTGYGYGRLECMDDGACSQLTVTAQGFLEVNCYGDNSCQAMDIVPDLQGGLLTCWGSNSCGGVRMGPPTFTTVLMTGPMAVHCEDGVMPSPAVVLDDEGACLSCMTDSSCAVSLSGSASHTCPAVMFEHAVAVAPTSAPTAYPTLIATTSPSQEYTVYPTTSYTLSPTTAETVAATTAPTAVETTSPTALETDEPVLLSFRQEPSFPPVVASPSFGESRAPSRVFFSLDGPSSLDNVTVHFFATANATDTPYAGVPVQTLLYLYPTQVTLEPGVLLQEQELVVWGWQDWEQLGDVDVFVGAYLVSEDSRYNLTVDMMEQPVQRVEADEPGLLVMPSFGVQVAAGEQSVVNVALSTRPQDGTSVVLSLSSSSGAMTFSPATLTFSSTDWDAVQPVVVVGESQSSTSTWTLEIDVHATTTDADYVALAAMGTVSVQGETVSNAGKNTVLSNSFVEMEYGALEQVFISLSQPPSSDLTLTPYVDTLGRDLDVHLVIPSHLVDPGDGTNSTTRFVASITATSTDEDAYQYYTNPHFFFVYVATDVADIAYFQVHVTVSDGSWSEHSALTVMLMPGRNLGLGVPVVANYTHFTQAQTLVSASLPTWLSAARVNNVVQNGGLKALLLGQNSAQDTAREYQLSAARSACTYAGGCFAYLYYDDNAGRQDVKDVVFNVSTAATGQSSDNTALQAGGVGLAGLLALLLQQGGGGGKWAGLSDLGFGGGLGGFDGALGGLFFGENLDNLALGAGGGLGVLTLLWSVFNGGDDGNDDGNGNNNGNNNSGGGDGSGDNSNRPKIPASPDLCHSSVSAYMSATRIHAGSADVIELILQTRFSATTEAGLLTCPQVDVSLSTSVKSGVLPLGAAPSINPLTALMTTASPSASVVVTVPCSGECGKGKASMVLTSGGSSTSVLEPYVPVTYSTSVDQTDYTVGETPYTEKIAVEERDVDSITASVYAGGLTFRSVHGALYEEGTVPGTGAELASHSSCKVQSTPKLGDYTYETQFEETADSGCDLVLKKYRFYWTAQYESQSSGVLYSTPESVAVPEFQLNTTSVSYLNADVAETDMPQLQLRVSTMTDATLNAGATLALGPLPGLFNFSQPEESALELQSFSDNITTWVVKDSHSLPRNTRFNITFFASTESATQYNQTLPLLNVTLSEQDTYAMSRQAEGDEDVWLLLVGVSLLQPPSAVPYRPEAEMASNYDVLVSWAYPFNETDVDINDPSHYRVLVSVGQYGLNSLSVVWADPTSLLENSCLECSENGIRDPTTDYTFTKLAPNMVYSFAVVPVNSAGEGPQSRWSAAVYLGDEWPLGDDIPTPDDELQANFCSEGQSPHPADPATAGGNDVCSVAGNGRRLLEVDVPGAPRRKLLTLYSMNNQRFSFENALANSVKYATAGRPDARFRLGDVITSGMEASYGDAVGTGACTRLLSWTYGQEGVTSCTYKSRYFNAIGSWGNRRRCTVVYQFDLAKNNGAVFEGRAAIVVDKRLVLATGVSITNPLCEAGPQKLDVQNALDALLYFTVADPSTTANYDITNHYATHTLVEAFTRYDTACRSFTGSMRLTNKPPCGNPTVVAQNNHCFMTKDNNNVQYFSNSVLQVHNDANCVALNNWQCGDVSATTAFALRCLFWVKNLVTGADTITNPTHFRFTFAPDINNAACDATNWSPVTVEHEIANNEDQYVAYVSTYTNTGISTLKACLSHSSTVGQATPGNLYANRFFMDAVAVTTTDTTDNPPNQYRSVTSLNGVVFIKSFFQRGRNTALWSFAKLIYGFPETNSERCDVWERVTIGNSFVLSSNPVRRTAGQSRGHLVAFKDMDLSAKLAQQTFHVSNMAPQVGSVNANSWASMESNVRELVYRVEQRAREGRFPRINSPDIYVITAVSGSGATITVDGTQSVTIPTRFYKVVCAPLPSTNANNPNDEYGVVGLWMNNDNDEFQTPRLFEQDKLCYSQEDLSADFASKDGNALTHYMVGAVATRITTTLAQTSAAHRWMALPLQTAVETSVPDACLTAPVDSWDVRFKTFYNLCSNDP